MEKKKKRCRGGGGLSLQLDEGMREKMRQHKKNMDEQMKGILTPEQYKEYLQCCWRH